MRRRREKETFVYRSGHLGVSLLVYAPVAFVLLSLGRPGVAALAGLGVVALSTLPDIDHRIPFVSHRGVTHTLGFAWLVGLAFGGVAYALPASDEPARVLAATFWFGVGVLGVLAHLLGDVLTPAGVPLLWPFSDENYSLHVTTAGNLVANALLLVLGVGATAAAVALATTPIHIRLFS